MSPGELAVGHGVRLRREDRLRTVCCCAGSSTGGSRPVMSAWGRGTALLLPRYLHGRQTGPLFRSDRRLGPARRAATASRDLCPEADRMRLGYDRVRTLIKHYTGPNLHQLRHSAATHLGEVGEDATVIMTKTHHRSIRTLARYTKPGLATIAKATERLDPPQRRS